MTADAQGSAFGSFQEGPIPGRITESGVEIRADEFGHEGTKRHPITRIPEGMFEAFEAAVLAAAAACECWVGDRSGAVAFIANFACNDARALADQVIEGDGRAAARTARAMFEHVVGMKYIGANQELADRYEQHISVHHQRLANLDTSQYLSKEKQKRERTRRDRLRGRTKIAYDAAIARWGARYAKSWSDRNLLDMATSVGLDGDYDGYRLLSGVTHGSAGGLDGAMRQIDGHTVLRFGPDLELSCLAFLLGFRWWLDFTKSMPPSTATDMARSTATDLLEWYEALVDETRRLDMEWWPPVAPQRRVAVALVWPNGATRWFLHDLVASTMQRALPPNEIPPGVADRLEETKAKAAQRRYSGAQNGRALSIACAGVTLQLDERAQVVSASSLLVPAEFNPHVGTKPRRVRSILDTTNR